MLEVVKFVTRLISLKIKQSGFKMIYGHISLSKKIATKSFAPFFNPKKIIKSSFLKKKKTLNEDHQHVEIQCKAHLKSFLRRVLSKKQHIKSSQEEKLSKKEKITKKEKVCHQF